MRLWNTGMQMMALAAVTLTLARSYLDPTGGGILISLLLAGTASPIIIWRLFLGRFRLRRDSDEGEVDTTANATDESSER